MSEKIFKYHDRLESMVDAISNRHDLAEYLEYMAEGFRAGMFEDQSVADYLDGAASITEALDSWCTNSGLELPEQPDWRWVGIIFTAAFAHS